MSGYNYKRESDYVSTFIAFFTSMFFAVLLAGFLLLLLTRWYVRESMKDVKEATDIYLKIKADRMKHKIDTTKE